MEVYIDNMVVNSRKEEKHLANVTEMFKILRRYKLCFNVNKCAFGVGDEKFLGYMITNRGIEVNLARI